MGSGYALPLANHSPDQERLGNFLFLPGRLFFAGLFCSLGPGLFIGSRLCGLNRELDTRALLVNIPRA